VGGEALVVVVGGGCCLQRIGFAGAHCMGRGVCFGLRGGVCGFLFPGVRGDVGGAGRPGPTGGVGWEWVEGG